MFRIKLGRGEGRMKSRHPVKLLTVGRLEVHMLIRAEEQRDWAAVRAVNVSAFETPTEVPRRVQRSLTIRLSAIGAGALAKLLGHFNDPLAQSLIIAG